MYGFITTNTFPTCIFFLRLTPWRAIYGEKKTF